MTNRITILALFLLIFASKTGLSQSVSTSDFTTGLTKGSVLGLGGAYRALANDNNALLFNPAGIMQNKHLAASADWLSGDYLKTDNWSGAIVDTRSEEQFGFGLAYDRISQEIVGNDIDYQQFTLGVAGKMADNFMVGISAKYYMSSIQNPLFDGPDGFTGDIGVLYLIVPALSVGATLQNFIEGTDNPNVPMLAAAAVAFRPDETVVLTMDVVQDFSTPNSKSTNFYWGGQLSLSEDFTVRTGYGLDQVRDDKFLGAGLLVTAPRAFLGFTYARHFDPGSDMYGAYIELRM